MGQAGQSRLPLRKLIFETEFSFNDRELQGGLTLRVDNISGQSVYGEGRGLDSQAG